MAKATANRCTNCGGELAFNPNTNNQKCEYCGSEYKPLNKKGEIEQETGLIPFKIDRYKARKEILKWIVSGDYVPGNILSGTEFGNFEQCYVPVYYFKGTCTGKYTAYQKSKVADSIVGKILPADRKKIAEGTINEPFTTVGLANNSYVSQYLPPQGFYNEYYERFGEVYNASGDIDHPVVDMLEGHVVNETEVVAADKSVLKQASAKEFLMTSDQSWETFGERNVIRRIRAKLLGGLEKPDEKEIAIDADYKITSAGKIYLPFWMINNHYAEDYEYNVCMDGASGNVIGEKIIDSSAKPSKKKIYKWSVAIGGLLSIAWYFHYFLYPNPPQYVLQHNNIFTSRIGGFWWFIRVILLWGVLPKILSHFIYDKASELKINKLKVQRERELEAVNSGELELALPGGSRKTVVKRAPTVATEDDLDEEDIDMGDYDRDDEYWDEEKEKQFQKALKMAEKWKS
ncbi:hypothetical protein MUY27_12875 [Mucilaginibacter sp. RS28]|uniref:Replication restart DNA helicase PriA n=1 Tax=Mucilaginibacter straminoryzae TaxID=2932774 RepID=A0A9X1X8Z7_9SPHI|nr:hypothetical protein [Mucilaginibacter straminoryzae]MCJ8210604.1 hypothetical protein [Mucilaginibacter straminoryzae]